MGLRHPVVAVIAGIAVIGLAGCGSGSRIATVTTAAQTTAGAALSPADVGRINATLATFNREMSAGNAEGMAHLFYAVAMRYSGELNTTLNDAGETAEQIAVDTDNSDRPGSSVAEKNLSRLMRELQ